MVTCSLRRERGARALEERLGAKKAAAAPSEPSEPSANRTGDDEVVASAV